MTIIKQYNANTTQWEAIAVGQKGDTGAGVANGGVTDAVLIKASNTDFDTTWSSNLNLTTLELTSTLTTADILPSVTNTYDLGSANNTWKDLYLSGNSIFLGNATITETTWDEVSTGVLPYDGTISGLTANTVKEAIDETVGLTDTAYSNAVAYADAVGNSAYSNAISYTDSAVANLIDTAPDALNTLNELAAALNDDPDFANTVVGQVTTAYTNATSYTDSSISALGLGSMATQNNNSVNIDGGTIDGTAVNATTLTASGDVNFDSGTLFVDASTNRVGIGTIAPFTQLDVFQANAKSATGAWQMLSFDTTSQTTGVGGGITFGGYKTAQTAVEFFAGIDGYKENSTAGNAAGALRFHTQVAGGTGLVERMRITSSGNVGIGTTSPAADLHVKSGANDGNTIFRVEGATDNNLDFSVIDTFDLNVTAGDPLSFSLAGTERMRITSSGNVGIGTTNPAARLSVLSASGEDAFEISGYDVFKWDNSNQLWFGGYRGSQWQVLKFATAGAERMRIDSSGNVLIGTTSGTPTAGNLGISLTKDGSSGGRINVFRGSSAFDWLARFHFGTSTVGGIQTSSTATSFLTSSDYRLKENIQPLTGALDKVQAMNPVTYDWKAGGRGEGFIAHELQEIAPYAVSGEKDGEDMQGVDYGKLTTLLVGAVKELTAKVKQLEAQLGA